jgi:hypothetical protein
MTSPLLSVSLLPHIFHLLRSLLREPVSIKISDTSTGADKGQIELDGSKRDEIDGDGDGRQSKKEELIGI